MRISGDKTESVYRRYAIVNVDDLRNAVKKLDCLLETQPVTEEPDDQQQSSTGKLQ